MYFSNPRWYTPGLLKAQVTLAVTRNNGTAIMNNAVVTQEIRLRVFLIVEDWNMVLAYDNGALDWRFYVSTAEAPDSTCLVVFNVHTCDSLTAVSIIRP